MYLWSAPLLRPLTLLALFLLSNSDLPAQILPEDLKLSLKREIRIVPTEVRLQEASENDGLDLVVWGSSMNDGDSVHPVLYFAILRDSVIAVEPTRMTGLESWPNRFLQVLPLSERWLVLWTNDTGRNSRTYSLLVNPDGTFSRPFELWEGHPLTQHGARAVRMKTRDFICWSDTGEVETVGRWLDHQEIAPGPRIIVDSGYLFLTRDYCNNIEGGLIEVSTGDCLRVRENRAIEPVNIPAIADSVDTYNITTDCALYTARGDTLRYFSSILDEEPKTVAILDIESWLKAAPVTRIHVGSDSSVSLSTLLEPTAGYSTGLVVVFERRYLLDKDLQITANTIIELPYFYANSHHSNRLEYVTPSDRNTRLPENGSYRDFSVHRSSYPLTVPVLFGDYPTNRISEFNGAAGGYVVLQSPFSLVKPSAMRRGYSEKPVIYFSDNANRPTLTSPTSQVMRFTNDDSPSIAHLQGRTFVTWLSYAHDTLVRTVELVGEGERLHPEEVSVGSDPDDGVRWIDSRKLYTIGPTTIRERKWHDRDRTWTEVSSLIVEAGLPRWNTIYVDAIGSDSSQFIAPSYYEPDNDAAWIVIVEQFHFSKVISPPNVSEQKTGVEKVRIFRVDRNGLAIDSLIAVPPPLDVEGLPPHPGNIGYIPVSQDEYVVISRPGEWRVQNDTIGDSLITPIGTTGKPAPYFGSYLLESYGTGSIARNNAALWIKTVDIEADTSTISDPYAPRNDGLRNLQTLVRQKDSVISLLYAWEYGIRTLTRQGSEWRGEQDITAASVRSETPVGVFVEDTLWVAYKAMFGNDGQIYVNGVVPDYSTSSSPTGTSPRTGRLTFSVERSPRSLRILSNADVTSGYLTDIYGRIVKVLDTPQIHGDKPVDTDGIPSGVYLVVLCGETCTGKPVQVVH